MLLFEKPSWEKVPVHMPINMQKQWSNFETVCWRNNFCWGLLACFLACLLQLIYYYVRKTLFILSLILLLLLLLSLY